MDHEIIWFYVDRHTVTYLCKCLEFRREVPILKARILYKKTKLVLYFLVAHWFNSDSFLFIGLPPGLQLHVLESLIPKEVMFRTTQWPISLNARDYKLHVWNSSNWCSPKPLKWLNSVSYLLFHMTMFLHCKLYWKDNKLKLKEILYFND